MAIATVLFPTLARFANAGEIDNLRATMANGMRQILFVLLPAAAAILALSDPMIRLVYQRGEFDPAETAIVATALFWFAFSLPTNGLYLLQTRTFFSLQRPWQATALAAIDLVVSAVAALVLYKPFGVGGIVAGTGIGTSTAVVAQAIILRREFNGLELGRLLSTSARITIASAALAGAELAGLEGARRGARQGPGRPDHLARRRPRDRRRRLLPDRQAAADRRARADHAAAAARALGREERTMLGPGRYLLGVVEVLLWRRARGRGRVAAAGVAGAAVAGDGRRRWRRR